MRTMRTKLQHLLWAGLATLIMAVSAPAATIDVYLWAGQVDKTMADGTTVPVWGYAQEVDGDFSTLEGTVQVPGPEIRAAVGDTLNIHLKNFLPEPTSMMVNGQIKPTNPVTFVDNRGRTRVQSFDEEAPTDGTIVTYTWNNVQAGTYLYQSASHLSVQVPMGLYGALVVDSGVSQAYPGISYDNEAVLLFSEIDPGLNAAVANGTYGTENYPTSMAVGYEPKYFLVNGASAPSVPSAFVGSPGETTILRFLNAGSRYRVPVINRGDISVVAQDGNSLANPFGQYSIDLSAGKTLDAIFIPQDDGPYTLHDRSLGLSNSGIAPGGMIVSLSTSAIPPMLTSDLTPTLASPQLIGTSVTFAANVTGGSGQYEYRFWLRTPDGVWTTVQPYSSLAFWTWDTGTLMAGNYRIVVWVRNSGSIEPYETYSFIDYTLNSPPASGATLSPAIASPQQAGATIDFSATGIGGSGDYQYRFWVRNPEGIWNIAQDYSTESIFTWDTVGFATGSYRIVVWVKNVGSTANYEAFAFQDYVLTTTTPVSDATLTSDLASPIVPGSSVNLTASATGGTGNYEYKFWFRNAEGVWSVVQDYSTTATYSWNTNESPSGNYRIVVWVRNLGSSSSYEAYSFLDFFLQ